MPDKKLTAFESIANWDTEEFFKHSSFLLNILTEVLHASADAWVIDYLPAITDDETPHTKASIEPSRMHNVKDLEKLVQVQSIYFQLLNIAEESCAALLRFKFEEEVTSEKPVHNHPIWTFRSFVAQLSQHAVEPDAIRQFLEQFEIQPVLTAHPTEAKRVTILEGHRRIYRELLNLDDLRLTPTEQSELRERIKAQIEILLQTGHIFLEKPRVTDEVENGLFYFKESFYPVVPTLLSRLYRALQREFPGERFDMPSVVHFSSWRGGDRDGNPFVTAEVTRATLTRHAVYILELYQDELKHLIKTLSYSSNEVRISDELVNSLHQDIYNIPQFEALKARNTYEPYRLKLAVMLERITQRLVTLQSEPSTAKTKTIAYQTPHDFLHDIAVVRRSLESHGSYTAAETLLRPLEFRVKTFGFHLAKLDIRENSETLENTIEELMKAKLNQSYQAMTEEERCAWLQHTIDSATPLLLDNHTYSAQTTEVLETFRTCVWARKHLSDESIGSYIISMTRKPSDLLMAYLIFKEIGAFENNTCPYSIVPLLETIDDLRRGPKILETLLSYPVIQARLSRRRRLQQIMVGYSDSNKDGGTVTSQWEVYDAQSEMVKVADRHNITLKFFHGMGGSLSRGGKPTHRTIVGLPPNTLRGQIKLTEQGEVISTKYANPDTALYNLKILAGSVMAASLENRINPVNVDEQFIQEMKSISQRAYKTYRALVETPGFVKYFLNTSPIEAISKLNIGSRPAKRKQTQGIEDLRAIPWVFSWTQNRHLLPAWFGAGTALQCDDDERLLRLRRMFSEWRFFNNLVLSLKVSLLNVNIDIAQQYSELCADESVRHTIFTAITQEFHRTVDAVLTITETQSLAEGLTRTAQTVAYRGDSLAQINSLQIELLKKLQSGTANDEDMSRLLLTINCIAAGLQSTG
jgi:phosphoenolpyruvate carboxylase